MGDQEGAEQAFRQLVAMDERDPESWLYLAKFLDRRGDDRAEEADRAFSTALSLAPDNPRVLKAIAQFYEQKASLLETVARANRARQTYKRNREQHRTREEYYEQAEQYYTRIERRKAGDPEPVLAKAELICHRQDDPERAATFLSAALSKPAMDYGPDWAPVWALLGEIHEDLLGDAKSAELAWRQACALDQDQAEYWLRLGLNLMRLGEMQQEAFSALDTCLRLAPDAPPALLAKGRLLAATGGQEQAAIDALRNLVEMLPTCLEARLDLSFMLASLPDKAEQAMNELTEAIKLTGQSGLPSFHRLFSGIPRPWGRGESRAEIHAFMATLAGETLGDHKLAARHWRAAVKLQPEERQWLMPLAFISHRHLGDHKTAETIYRRMVRANPDDNWAMAQLAEVVAQDRNRWAEAEALWREALLADPSDVVSWILLSRLLWRDLQHFDEAIDLLDKALKHNKNSKRLTAERATAYAAQLDTQHPEHAAAPARALLRKVKSSFATAHKLDRTNQPLLRDWGVMLFDHANDPVEAATRLRGAIELKPDDGLAWAHLGRVVRAAPDKLKVDLSYARSYLEKALELEQKTAWIWVEMGLLYARQGEKHAGDAENAFKAAIELEPQNDQAWTALSRLYLKHKSRLTAIETLREAVKVAPDSGSNHYLLGHMLFERRADDMEAFTHLKRATALMPTHAEAWADLALLHDRNGRRDEASAACALAMKYGASSHELKALADWLGI
ncbi:MAG: hypothetical protein Alpg2KO_25080 [Alphaproteobacteria bacterium]